MEQEEAQASGFRGLIFGPSPPVSLSPAPCLVKHTPGVRRPVIALETEILLSPGKARGEFLLTSDTEVDPEKVSRLPTSPGDLLRCFLGRDGERWGGRGAARVLGLRFLLLCFHLPGLSSSRNFDKGILPNTHQPDLFYSCLCI